MPTDETLVPRVLGPLDTGDLKPLEMTGFRPAFELGDTSPRLTPQVSETVLPGPPRPKFVIGDAPLSGETMVGRSPFAPPEADRSSEEQGMDPTGEFEGAPGEETPARGWRPPPHSGPAEDPLQERQAPRTRRSPSGNRRRGLLIAIAATAGLAVLVIGAAVVKFTSAGRSGVVLASPAGLPRLRFSGTIQPGNRTVTEATRQVDLEPGTYTLEAIPADGEYLPLSITATVKPGAMEALSLAFQRKPEPEAAAEPQAEAPAVPQVPDEPPPATEPRPDPTSPTDAPSREQPQVVSPEPAARAEPKARAPEPVVAAPTRARAQAAAAEDPSTERQEAQSLWEASIVLAERGVEIFIGDRRVGVTPNVVVRDLIMGNTYDGQARKAGFEVLNFTLSNPMNMGRLEQRLEMVRASPERSPGARSSEPSPAPASNAVDAPPEPRSAQKGKLICTSRPVGAEVLIDGKPTGRKTPIPRGQALELPLGTHRIVFRLDGKSTAPIEFTLNASHQDTPLLIRGEF